MSQKFKARWSRKSSGFQIKMLMFESWLHAYQEVPFLSIHNLSELPFPHWKSEANADV